MNAKKLFAFLIAVALLGTACAPIAASNSAHVLSAAQSVNNNTSNLIPVTGKSVPDAARYVQSQMSQKSHSSCSSANSLRQDGCGEQATQSGSIILTGNADSQVSPSQQFHSACASENSQRQDSCVP